MNAKRLFWVAGVPLLVALVALLSQQPSALAQPRPDRSLTKTQDDLDDNDPPPPPGRGGPHGGMPGSSWGRRGGWGMGGGGMWMGGPEMMLLRGGDGPLGKELNLSSDQKKKLSDIGDRMMRQSIKRSSDIELAMLDLRTSLKEDNPDPAKVDRQIDQIANLRAEQAKGAVNARLEARQVLTREQREKLRDWMPRGRPPGSSHDHGSSKHEGSQHGGGR